MNEYVGEIPKSYLVLKNWVHGIIIAFWKLSN